MERQVDKLEPIWPTVQLICQNQCNCLALLRMGPPRQQPANNSDQVSMATLNYALGNLSGRPKDWLSQGMAAPAFAASTDRSPFPQPPPKRRKLPPKQLAPARATEAAPASGLSLDPRQSASYSYWNTESLAPAQPLSTSASPRLANVLIPVEETVSTNTLHVVYFPSPSPSQETLSPPTGYPGSGIQPNVSLQTNYGPDTQLETVDKDAAQRDRVTSLARKSMDSPKLTFQHSQSNRSAQTRQHQLLSSSHTPPQPRHVPGPPPVQSRNINGAHHPVPAGRGPFPTEHVVPWYTRDACVEILSSFLAKNPSLPPPSTDEFRLDMLRVAVEWQDWEYLCMHQYYCLLSCRSLPIQSIHSHPHIQGAFEVLRETFGDNSMLSPALFDFFCHYPFSIATIASNWQMGFKYQLLRFTSFTDHSTSYQRLKFHYQQRKVPPLPRELCLDLGIASPGFQYLLFKVMLKHITQSSSGYIPHPDAEGKACAMFTQKQIDFKQARICPDQPDAYRNELESWSSRMRPLVNKIAAVQNHSQQQQLSAAPPSTHMQSPHLANESDFRRQSGLVQSSSMSSTNQQMQRHDQSTLRPVQHAHVVPSYQQIHNRPTQPMIRSQPLHLLPVRGWQLRPQRVADPIRHALHQAHLRSPVLKAERISSPLFRSWQNHVLLMRLTEGGQGQEIITFTLTHNEVSLLAKVVPDYCGGPELRTVSETTKTIRLRCIKWESGKSHLEHECASAVTSWIPHSYFTLNGTHLEQRTKTQHGKDLPIDITSMVQEGKNTLEIAIMADSHDTTFLNYVLAIEYVGVESQDTIRQNCWAAKRSAAAVRTSIITHLTAPTDDDEVIVTLSDLTITLLDPFDLCAIPQTPVRSTTCLHHSCFDLDHFLQSRTRDGDASAADQWLCPICGADARPGQLFVDGFIEDVRTKLEAQGLANTRAIKVFPDGSWKPKEEERDPNGVSDVRESPGTRTSVPPGLEVVEIDD